jgi:hypothetical protein
MTRRRKIELIDSMNPRLARFEPGLGRAGTQNPGFIVRQPRTGMTKLESRA